jgi:hypothetical protein
MGKYQTRKPSSGRGIIPEAVVLYLRMKEIRMSGMHDVLEAEGGRKDEYREGRRRLGTLLGVAWFEADPVGTDDPCPPDFKKSNPLQADRWLRSRELRCELERASRR